MGEEKVEGKGSRNTLLQRNMRSYKSVVGSGFMCTTSTTDLAIHSL